MLVLSREEGEQIVIGKAGMVLTGPVVVTLVRVVRGTNHHLGGKVRIGIEADANVPVHRREVYEAIEAEERGGEKP